MLEEHDHKHAVHEFDGIIENRVTTPPVYFTVLFYGLIIWGVVFSAYYLFSGWSSEKEFTAEMSAYQQQQTTAGEQTAQTAEAGKEPAQAGAAGGGKEAAEIDAAGLYATHCAMCHGAEGEGGIGPALTAPNYIYGSSQTDIVASISGGRPNGMPGFEKKLSDAEIEALAAYLGDWIQAASGAEAEADAASAGAEQRPASKDQTETAEQEQTTEPAKATATEETSAEEPATSGPAIAAAEIFAQRCAVCHGADGAGSGIGPDLTDPDYIYGKSQDEVVKSIRDGRPNGMPGFGNQLPEAEISALAEYVREL